MHNTNTLINSLILLVLLFFVPSDMSSQNSGKYKLKWGQVSKEGLKMKTYPGDPDAAAVVLGESGTIKFELAGNEPKIILAKHIRIKILAEGGMDWADISLPYHKETEIINAVKAQSIQPDGTVSKLLKKDIHENERNKYWDEIKFAIPNVQVGSVIEYKYEKEVKNIFQLPTWYFQSSIPKRWSRITISVPRFYHYLSVKEFTEGIMEDRKDYRRVMSVPKFEGNGYSDKKTKEGTQRLDVITTDYIYTMKKVPGFEKDPLVGSSLDYYSKLYFQLYETEFLEGDIEVVDDTWDKYVSDRMEHPSFGRQYANERNYKKVMAAISPQMEKAETADEKISIISRFILDNIQWNGYYGTYSNQDLDDVLEEKSGTGAEMNLMGIALLNHFGIASHPVLVSTRANGKVIESYPIVNQFNHVIIRMQKEGMLLDFSGLPLKNGLIRPEALNLSGLAIVGEKEYDWVEIKTPVSSTVRLVKATLDEKGGLKGELNVMNDNYTAFANRGYYHGKDNDEGYAGRFFKKDFGIVEIEGLEVKNENETNKKFMSKMDFSIPEFSSSSNQLIYLPIMLDEGWSWIEKPLKREKRNYPLDLPFAFKDKYITNIVVPEGYVIDEIPENINVATPDGNFSFSYVTSFEKGKLQIIISLSSEKYHYSVAECVHVKDFFTIVSERVNGLVVLKKK